jgi:hypothetical protein
MGKPVRVLCLISISIAIPEIAIAQSTTAFDGTYAGVSNTGGGFCSPFMTVPRPLTIRNGVAQFQGGFQSQPNLNFEGGVSPQGDLRMKDQRSHIATGHIDQTGKATASVFNMDPNCTLVAVWQKQ